MTKRKLKGYVLPTLYMTCIGIIVLSLTFITKDLKTSNGEDTTYVMNALVDEVKPVINTEQTTAIKPFTSDKVNVNKTFYDKNDTPEVQEKSLIYYENTYLQNSGIIYSSAEEFEIIASLDGTVVDVKQDEILNTVVYLSHDNNITTIYYGLKDVTVKVNDKISQGEKIGKSNCNKFSSEKNSMLFEVNNNGQVINPEQLYTTNSNELN